MVLLAAIVAAHGIDGEHRAPVVAPGPGGAMHLVGVDQGVAALDLDPGGRHTSPATGGSRPETGAIAAAPPARPRAPCRCRGVDAGGPAQRSRTSPPIIASTGDSSTPPAPGACE
jgi:hypothetical protein